MNQTPSADAAVANPVTTTIPLGSALVPSTVVYAATAIPKMFVWPSPSLCSAQLNRDVSCSEARTWHVSFNPTNTSAAPVLYDCACCRGGVGHPTSAQAHQLLLAGYAACPVIQAARAGVTAEKMGDYVDALRQAYG